MCEFARLERRPSRYNSNHRTRISWGAGLNSARWEREAPRYNSNHGTWLERVGGGGMWPLGYKSSFFMFGE